ncbi:hypothetical protein ACJW31_03G001000 [Castanea mollissima]
MSLSDKEIVNVGGSGGGAVDDNNSVGGGVHARDVVDDDDNGKKQRGYGYGCCIGCTRSFTKARQAVLNPFAKAKKQFLRRKNKRTSSSSSGSTGARISGKRFGCLKNGGKGCCFCLRQPQTLESNSGSRTSDPNDPNFTYDMLKAFIENNDFYSKDCNPHFDFDLSSHATE